MNQALIAECSNSYVSCERLFYPHRMGQPLFTVQELTAFMSAACDALKEQNNCANQITIFLESVLDERHGTCSHFSINAALPMPSNEPEQLFTTVKQSLTKLYSSNERYMKCGLILLDLVSEDSLNLFANPFEPKKQKRFDLDDEYSVLSGKNRLKSQAMRSWKSKGDRLAPKTVDWKDLATVLAK